MTGLLTMFFLFSVSYSLIVNELPQSSAYLQLTVKEMRNEINKMKQDYAINQRNIHQRFDKLEEEYQKNQTEMQQRFDKLQEEFQKNQTELQKELQSAHHNYIQIEHELAKTKQELDIIKQESLINDTVGFTASFNSTVYAPDEILYVEHVFANYGNDFDGTTGIYTCTRAGMYYFHLTLITSKGVGKAYIAGYVNNVPFTYASSYARDYYENGSATLVIRLNIGDRMWVQSANNNFFDHKSHFTGMLIAK